VGRARPAFDGRSGWRYFGISGGVLGIAVVCAVLVWFMISFQAYTF
jgi:hypothetical protein